MGGERARVAAAALHEGVLRSEVFDDAGVEALARRLDEYYTLALQGVMAEAAAWQSNIEVRGYAYAAMEDLAQSGARAETEDVGARYARPLAELSRRLGAGGRQPAAAPPQASATPTVGVRPVAALQDAVWRGPTVGSPALHPVALTSAMRQAEPVKPVRAAAEMAAIGRNVTVYVWNGAEVMRRAQDPAFWSGLRRLSITRLLLSLDAAQIKAAHTQPALLNDFLDQARARGVAVELLLGEASWIDVAHRADLFRIIQDLREFRFDGLHLDIEPDQIYRQPLSRAQFEAWVTTLTEAAAAAPWPTSVDVHPRYFRDAPYVQWRLGERLRAGGVHEAVLMIYNANPERVAAVGRPIAASAPQLRFRVAQSVEPGLPAELSHAHRPPAELQRRMTHLEQLLATQPNVDGIVIQAWTDLMRMGYENQIR